MYNFNNFNKNNNIFKKLSFNMPGDESIQKLIKELSKSLLDPTLLKRYGTNMDPSMSLDYENYLMKRYNELKIEFTRINKNIDDGITIDELYEFLNSYSQESGMKFNKEYADKLYNMLDLDQNKEITIQEFIFSYILLEERLRLKQMRLQKFYDELSITNEKYKKAMFQNKNEKINKHGIADTALLYVTVLEGKDLKKIESKDTPDPYVVLTMDLTKQMSSYRPESLDPIWNEDFSFTVISKDQNLKIEVFDHDYCQGSIEILMTELIDQQKYEGWYFLNNMDGEETTVQIRLRIQFIWSRYLYFHEKCEKAKLNLERLNADIQEINKYLDLFNKPYGLILYGEILEVLNRKVFDEKDELTCNFNRKKSMRQSNASTMNLKKKNTVRFFNKLKAEFSIFRTVLIFLYFLFSIINMIDRSDFPNLLFSTSMILVYYIDKKGRYYEKIISFFFIFIIIFLYDLGYMTMINENSSMDKKNIQSEIQYYVKRFVFYSSICSAITKLGLFLSLISQYLNAQEVDKIIESV